MYMDTLLLITRLTTFIAPCGDALKIKLVVHWLQHFLYKRVYIFCPALIVE
jgi:hypothetical protein